MIRDMRRSAALCLNSSDSSRVAAKVSNTAITGLALWRWMGGVWQELKFSFCGRLREKEKLRNPHRKRRSAPKIRKPQRRIPRRRPRMARHLLQRFLLPLPPPLLLLTLVFLMIHIVPGDPVELMLCGGAPPGGLVQLRHTLGLGLPLHGQ